MPETPDNRKRSDDLRDIVLSLQLPAPVVDELCELREKYAAVAPRSRAACGTTFTVGFDGGNLHEDLSVSPATPLTPEQEAALAALRPSALLAMDALTTEQRSHFFDSLRCSTRIPILEFRFWLLRCIEEYSLGPRAAVLQEACSIDAEIPPWVDDALRAFDAALLSGSHVKASTGLHAYCSCERMVPALQQSFACNEDGLPAVRVDKIVTALRQHPQEYEGMIRDLPPLMRTFATTFFDAARPVLATAVDQLRTMDDARAHNYIAYITIQLSTRIAAACRSASASDLERVARAHIILSATSAIAIWLIDQWDPSLCSQTHDGEAANRACRNLVTLSRRATEIDQTLSDRLRRDSRPPAVSASEALKAVQYSAGWLANAVACFRQCFRGKIPQCYLDDPPEERGPDFTPWTRHTSIGTTDSIPDIDVAIDGTQPGLTFGIHSVIGKSLEDAPLSFSAHTFRHRPHDAPTISFSYHIPLRDSLGREHPLAQFADIVSQRGDNINEAAIDLLLYQGPAWIDTARDLGILLRVVNRYQRSNPPSGSRQHQSIKWEKNYILLTREEATRLAVPATELRPLDEQEFICLRQAGLIFPSPDVAPAAEASTYVCWDFPDVDGEDFPDDGGDDDDEPTPAPSPFGAGSTVGSPAMA